MITSAGVEYIQSGCVYRAKYETDYMPGDDKPNESVLGLLYCCIIASGGMVAEKKCNNTTAVEWWQRNKIKYQQDNIK